ncbi:hypothetical protein FRB97_000774, partial [Tulasnella sp. 331]
DIKDVEFDLATLEVIIRLSTVCKFAANRGSAMKAITKQTGLATHIRVAVEYNVEALLMPACIGLCTWSLSLAYEKASELGICMNIGLTKISMRSPKFS